MQPGEFSEENIARKVKYGDDILVFHKTQGQMPIRFARVNQEYLFFFDIDETQNLYSVMDGRIHLKDIDRIEVIKRSDYPTGVDWDSGVGKGVKGVSKILIAILLFPLMIALAL
jgi:hypothetical protein